MAILTTGLKFVKQLHETLKLDFKEGHLALFPSRPAGKPENSGKKEKRERGFQWLCCSSTRNHRTPHLFIFFSWNYPFSFTYLTFIIHPLFKTMEKLILLPKISFKPSVISLKTTFLWFSEELCVRARTDYFDNPLKNQRSKYSVARNVPVCIGLWSHVCLHMNSFTHCIVIHLWEGRMKWLQGPRGKNLLPLYNICQLKAPPEKGYK